VSEAYFTPACAAWRHPRQKIFSWHGKPPGFTQGLTPTRQDKKHLRQQGAYLPVRQEALHDWLYRVRRQPPACPVKYPEGEQSVFHTGVCRLSGTSAKKYILLGSFHDFNYSGQRTAYPSGPWVSYWVPETNFSSTQTAPTFDL
jgi:hypothetical protein